MIFPVHTIYMQWIGHGNGANPYSNPSVPTLVSTAWPNPLALTERGGIDIPTLYPKYDPTVRMNPRR